MSQSPVDKIAFQERTRREILVKSDLIPPLPDIVVRVLALLNAGNTEPKDLEEHLHCDPVLVAKMLAIVNSPFYGVMREIRTIKDAVMVLGFRGVRSLLLASGTAKFLQSDFACYGHGDKGLWKHSLAVASCAKTLAGAVGESPDRREELFVAGLLHDIGKMLLAPYLRDKGLSVTDGPEAIKVEVETLGLDHFEAGGLVTAKWGLSETIQKAITSVNAAPNEDDDQSVRLIRIANAIAHDLTIGYEEERLPAPIDITADVKAIGLDDEGWEQTRTSMDEAVAAALSQLDGLCS